LTATADALLTDLYCLTMAADYVHEGAADDLVTFELFTRRLPDGVTALTVAGVEEALSFLERLRFDEHDLAWLAAADPVTFDDAALSRLASVRFNGTVWAPQEGTIVPAGTPLLRLTATRLEATLVETPLLAAVNYGVRVASNATAIVRAAAGRPVWDFSMRRLDGTGAAHTAARASYLAGFAGTATAAAARDLALPVTGTMSHAKVMARGREQEIDVFCAQLRARPAGATLLVDTYDCRQGVANAIEAQRLTGGALKAIRVDSGDLADEAAAARAMLDGAGLTGTAIILTGDLDAQRIAELLAVGAPAASFGVGTRLRAGEAVDGVYKLVEQHGESDVALRFTMKLATDKPSDPGVHQVTRRPEGSHVLHLEDERPDGVALLREVMRDGERTALAPSLDDDRLHAARELAAAPAGGWPPLVRSPRLLALRARLATPREEHGAMSETALIVVDVQHDFLPGGAVGVPEGDEVVEPLVRAARAAALVVKTRDAHPQDHCSFADRGGIWPEHCIDGTHGAQLHPVIAALPGPVLDKATTSGADAYSGFDGTGLTDLLREAGIAHVLVGGLATDYCVKATVLDALAAGFEATVLTDAVAAVNVEEGDAERALDEMVAVGARTARADEIQWGREDSNLRLTDYESAALTN
jgi:putative nicotinate phosphoribosyltransferase